MLGYLSLIGLTVSGPLPPKWAWLVPLMLPVIGAVLQYACTRILCLMAFEIIGWFFVVATFAAVAWRAFSASIPEQPRWEFALLIAIAIGVPGVVTIATRLRSQSLIRMPCGPYGRPDPHTGLIRDPFWSEPGPTETSSARSVLIAYLLGGGPLVVALAGQFVRSQAVSGRILLLGVGALCFAGFATWFAAWILAHVVAIRRWERKHGKQIHITR